jgi:hypothetical protein
MARTTRHLGTVATLLRAEIARVDAAGKEAALFGVAPGAAGEEDG